MYPQIAAVWNNINKELDMDKSIDLGKLQNDLQKARALLKSATSEVERAQLAYTRAISVMEKASEKRRKMQTEVDNIKTSLVEATRAVANS
jgi:hypothetical protein